MLFESYNLKFVGCVGNQYDGKRNTHFIKYFLLFYI